jgi:(E)-4-hydroxy-3-methylbut-2-enyl-diphosphate synthase
MINNREKTRKVMVRNVQIGHQNKVIIQSMTNTKTSNVVTTLKQIKTLVNNGAELVRVAVLDDADAMALKSIVHSSPCPIIADIHYNYHFAMTAITSGVAKIRINPANIDPKHLKEIVDCAKVHKTAIRIGANQGSKLNQRQFHTPKEMVDCVCNLIKMFEK